LTNRIGVTEQIAEQFSTALKVTGICIAVLYTFLSSTTHAQKIKLNGLAPLLQITPRSLTPIGEQGEGIGIKKVTHNG